MSKNTTRRKFLSGSAAFAGAATIGTKTSLANAQQQSYVIDPPEIVSMEIEGSKDRFPVRRVFCLGRNYRAHAIESGDNPDETPPFFFIKPRDAITPSRDGHPYPQVTKELRYEAEMVVALKKGGSDISQSAALDHVFGYGIGLDMTRQDLQEEAQRLS